MAALMGFEALTRAGRSSIASRFSVVAAWTRELHQVRRKDAEEEVPGLVDALFVDEYEPVGYGAADKSVEKRAAGMGIGCVRACRGQVSRGRGHPMR